MQMDKECVLTWPEKAQLAADILQPLLQDFQPGQPLWKVPIPTSVQL